MSQPTTVTTALIPPVAGVKRKRVPDRKFYAVKQGKRPGIYHTWEECLEQVRGQKGALFKAFQSLHEAQAFVDGRELGPMSRQSGDQKFYAVQNGHVPGVYTDWPSAQKQIRNVKHPRHKKFTTRAEAEAFVAAGSTPNYTQYDHLTPDEQIRRMIVQKTPGLYLNNDFVPRDKDGKEYEPGRGPLPPGAEDGFDPNLKLAEDGSIVRRDEVEKFRTKLLSRERDVPGILRIYTDGSSLKNGQAGARAGVGVFFGPQDPKNVSEALRGSKQTNQRAELTAIQRALDIAPRHRDVEVYTDSKYAISCVTEWYRGWVRNGWKNSKGKPVENKDLIEAVRDKIEERDSLRRTTRFMWVRGHNGDAGNVAADRLAVDGARLGRGVDVEGEESLSRAEDAEESVGESDAVAGEEESPEIAEAYRAMEAAMAEDDGFFDGIV